jgi:hypothetical protein
MEPGFKTLAWKFITTITGEGMNFPELSKFPDIKWNRNEGKTDRGHNIAHMSIPILDVNIITLGSAGLQHRKCVIVKHAEYTVVMERVWPIYYSAELLPAIMKKEYMLGDLNFYVTGNMNTFIEHALFMQLRFS